MTFASRIRAEKAAVRRKEMETLEDMLRNVESPSDMNKVKKYMKAKGVSKL